MKRKSPPPQPKRRYTPEQRAHWLEQYERSQLSVPKFAVQHGLSPSTLHSWRYQQRNAVTESSLIQPEGKPNFQEVPVAEIFRASGSWAGELQLANGDSLRWNPQASLVVLQSLLTHLRRSC